MLSMSGLYAWQVEAQTKRMRSLDDAAPQERRLLHSLAWMCVQYIGEYDQQTRQYLGLDHQCMGAGEEAVDLLVSYGLIEPSGRGGAWTDLGRKFLDGEPI
jgi:hypothetical protein